MLDDRGSIYVVNKSRVENKGLEVTGESYSTRESKEVFP